MKRTTTLIATIGRSFDRPSQRVADVAENVALEQAPEAVESLTEWVDQLRSTWVAAQRRSTIYTVLTGDPIAPAVREWARRLDGRHSDLELAIGLLGDAPMPDFYLVDPGISGSRAHWYLDHLPRLAPRRMVLTEPTERAVLASVSRLPYGRALPETVDLLATARTYVPLPEIDSQAETTLLS
ncbi:MAG TPA: hypothetical protein VIW46_09695 [Acidimicrobiia bacterium]|jgi:hypothetical protein